VEQARDLVDEALSTAQFALRAAVFMSLNTSSGTAVFGRDMLLEIPLLADWELIQTQQQQLADKALHHMNIKRHSYD
jgi:hypothetical protein